jgi:hypothetical protein
MRIVAKRAEKTAGKLYTPLERDLGLSLNPLKYHPSGSRAAIGTALALIEALFR